MSLLKYLLSLFLFAAPLLAEIDHGVRDQFSSLIEKSPGILPEVPLEIRALRTGPVVQKVSISDKGELVLTSTFSYKGEKGSLKQASSVKRFWLQDIQEGSEKKVEINKHTNSMTFIDRTTSWSVGFKSHEELEIANNLFLKLLEQAPERQKKSEHLSSFFQKEGYRFLVACPRYISLEECAHLLNTPTFQSPSLYIFATKHTPSEIEEVLEQANNALPLFFYDLTLLDDASFYTQSIPFQEGYSFATLDERILQSAQSDDSPALQSFLKKSSFSGIVFSSLPDFSNPLHIICRPQDKHSLAKALRSNFQVEDKEKWSFATSLFYQNDIPEGSSSLWLTPLNENSLDIARFLFSKEENFFSPLLFREFPDLSTLVSSKSRFKKELSIKDFASLAYKDLLKKKSSLSQRTFRIIKCAIFSEELGSMFGPQEEIIYNSWPHALAIAEIMGLSEKDRLALKYLLESETLLFKKATKEQKDPSLSLLVEEETLAGTTGFSLKECLQMKLCLFEILAQYISIQDPYMLVQTKALLKKAGNFSFNLPKGSSFVEPPFATRGLFSSYVWEIRDPKHRDGLHLKRKRDKYEKLILKHPTSPWKGHFWQWLDKEADEDSPGTLYLTNDEDRKPYLAHVQEGIFSHPDLPDSEEEISLLFVIDAWGKLYLGKKKDAASKEEKNFNHASFFAGNPVASAGVMVFKNKHLISLSDHSGHYRSRDQEMLIAIKTLIAKGVDVKKVSVEISSSNQTKKKWSSATNFLKHAE